MFCVYVKHTLKKLHIFSSRNISKMGGIEGRGRVKGSKRKGQGTMGNRMSVLRVCRSHTERSENHLGGPLTSSVHLSLCLGRCHWLLLLHRSHWPQIDPARGKSRPVPSVDLRSQDSQDAVQSPSLWWAGL